MEVKSSRHIQFDIDELEIFNLFGKTLNKCSAIYYISNLPNTLRFKREIIL